MMSITPGEDENFYPYISTLLLDFVLQNNVEYSYSNKKEESIKIVNVWISHREDNDRSTCNSYRIGEKVLANLNGKATDQPSGGTRFSHILDIHNIVNKQNNN